VPDLCPLRCRYGLGAHELSTKATRPVKRFHTRHISRKNYISTDRLVLEELVFYPGPDVVKFEKFSMQKMMMQMPREHVQRPEPDSPLVLANALKSQINVEASDLGLKRGDSQSRNGRSRIHAHRSRQSANSRQTNEGFFNVF
jgi:hypothetical protein